MLSPDQIKARDGKLTASRVACLMNGSAEGILNLWREMVGDPSYEPSDLSGVWAVQLGIATEGKNLDWFERHHSPVTRRGEVVVGAKPWMACTLDGWSELHECPVEAKHCGGHEPLQTIVDRYQPQLQWQMIVTRTEQCALSVIMGAREPVVEFVPSDADYAAELLQRAHAFMDCVWSLTPPVALPAVAPPAPPGKVYDMGGRNEWAFEAGVWLDNIAAKKVAEAAERSLKAMVPDDAVRCVGHGVAIYRDRAGRLSLRQEQGS